MMTPEEHMFMLLLLFKQQQAIQVLLDILKSRGILTADDEDAFSSALLQNAALNSDLFSETREKYLLIAQSVGLETGLERLPDPSLDWFHPPKP